MTGNGSTPGQRPVHEPWRVATWADELRHIERLAVEAGLVEIATRAACLRHLLVRLLARGGAPDRRGGGREAGLDVVAPP